MKYIKKPIAIDAIQYTGENADEIKEFAGEKCIIVRNTKQIVIETLEGDMVAEPGDYIIKNVKGKFYPVKQDVFEMSYEEFSPDKDNDSMCKRILNVIACDREGNRYIWIVSGSDADNCAECSFSRNGDCNKIAPCKHGYWYRIKERMKSK